MAPVIEFWFDFASTYSYPAAFAVEDAAAKRGVGVAWRSFLLGPIFAAQGWMDSPFNIYPAKGAYMWRDMERICAAQGLPLKRPSQFPRVAILACRVASRFKDEPWAGAFVKGIYHANFAEDRDIASPDVVGDILGRVGVDADAAIAAATAQDSKDAFRAQVDHAVARGLIGAPSFVVGDEIFWGGDRLTQALDWAIGAQAVDAGL
ncbi:MAG: 2-hydroxychromene-2-carboxylate isomerase [Alphaproteobacteria bacterium]|nr:2-hydroxychromene-2-carboxylate isomerase [Alphaproteobacteria bacterium]